MQTRITFKANTHESYQFFKNIYDVLPENETNPVVLSVPSNMLHNFEESTAIKSTYPRKNPAVCPTLLQVEACPKFFLK